MTTARDLCLGALRDAGVLGAGQTASAEDITDAMLKLNRMLAQWAVRRWLIYATTDTALQATGAASYGIGPTSDVPRANRPPRVDGAYVRLYAGGPNQIDYPLQQIDSRDDYNLIALKGLGGVPAAYFYDNAFPIGRVFVYPIPSNAYELHLNLWTPIGPIANPTAPLNLPPEYEEVVHYNMAVRLRAAYRLPADPVLGALATAGMATLRSVNGTVPQMQLSGAVLPRGPVAGAPYSPALGW